MSLRVALHWDLLESGQMIEQPIHHQLHTAYQIFLIVHLNHFTLDQISLNYLKHQMTLDEYLQPMSKLN